MRPFVYKLAIFVLITALPACELLDDYTKNASKLSFRSRTLVRSKSVDSLIFRGTSIDYVSENTGEVVFADTLMPYYMRSFKKVTCYLDKDSLFSFRVTSDTIRSLVVNDLVLNYEVASGRYVFQDGFPLNYAAGTNARLQNKNKRAASWQKFIERLKVEGRDE